MIVRTAERTELPATFVLPEKLSLPQPDDATTFCADKVDAPKVDPRMRAELDRFMGEQESLRKEYIPKMCDLAADKAVPGGSKVLGERRIKVKAAADRLEKALTEKWPLAIEKQLHDIDRAYVKVKDIFDATGGKPITSPKLIEEFKKEYAAAMSQDPEAMVFPPTGLTADMARDLVVLGKTKLYRLENWVGFEFQAAAICGWLGSKGEDISFSAEVPDAAKAAMRKDPNLKERRDKAIQDAWNKYGGRVEAIDAINERVETYKNIKGVFDAYVELSRSTDDLARAERQVMAAIEANSKDWLQGDAFPEFKKLQKEFLDKRDKTFEAAKVRMEAVKEIIQKEESEKRRK